MTSPTTPTESETTSTLPEETTDITSLVDTLSPTESFNTQAINELANKSKESLASEFFRDLLSMAPEVLGKILVALAGIFVYVLFSLFISVILPLLLKILYAVSKWAFKAAVL